MIKALTVYLVYYKLKSVTINDSINQSINSSPHCILKPNYTPLKLLSGHPKAKVLVIVLVKVHLTNLKLRFIETILYTIYVVKFKSDKLH